MISRLKFKSLIHFELFFEGCRGEWFKTGIQFYFSACGYPVFSTPFIEELLLFSIEYF